MIARMLKTFVVSKLRDRDGLIGTLGELGVVHIEPVDSARAVAQEQTVNAISQIVRAQQLLSSIQPAG